MRPSLLSLLSLLLVSFDLFAKPVYVKSFKADIHETPSNAAKILETVPRGVLVDMVSQDKQWIQVKTSSVKGWVSSLFLSSGVPMQSSSLLEKNVDISSKARKRASRFTSAAAARGLKADSDNVFKNLGDEDFEALKKMELLFVSSEEGLLFLNDEKTNIISRMEK